MRITNMTRSTLTRGEYLPFRVFVDDGSAPLVGQDIQVSLSRESDGLLFDFDDDTFKISPTTANLVLTDVTGVPGLYEGIMDFSTLTETDRLLFIVAGTAETVGMTVEVVNRTDLVSDLSVSYDPEAEAFTFMTSLMSKDGLLTDADAEPLLQVYDGSDGSLVFEAEHTDFSEDNGVFTYEYTGTGIGRGTFLAVLRFDAFDVKVMANLSFNVG